MDKHTEWELLSELAKKAPHYENSKLIDYCDESLMAQDFLHDQLSELGIVGNVISTYRDEGGKLHYVVDALTNCLTIGATGTGKSTGPFEEQCLMNAEGGGASLVIIDSKGAQYNRFASKYRSLGYDVKLINLRDPWHSEGWNPFARATQTYMRKMDDVGKNAREILSKSGKTKFRYKGKNYIDKKFLATEFEREMKQYQHELYTELYSICSRMWPIQSSKDPYWERSGRVVPLLITTALALDVFAIDAQRRTTIEQVNFAAVKAVFETFETKRGTLDDKGFLSDRGNNSIAYAMSRKNISGNASTTLSNILGFSEQDIHIYDHTSFLTISLATTIDVRDLATKKTVLFITYDEMDPLNRSFVSLLLPSLIQELKETADNSEMLTLDRPVLFMIDEFPSLGRIQEIVEASAYGRSRKIFVHPVVQSTSQIYALYGEMDARTLIENCNTMIYLGSNSWATLKEFSASLGSCTIISPTSVLNGGNIVLEEHPLVPCSELAIFSQGEGYVRRLGKHTLKAHFEKSYECPEYKCEHSKLSEYESKLAELYPICHYDVGILSQTEDEDNDDDDDEDNDDDDDLF